MCLDRILFCELRSLHTLARSFPYIDSINHGTLQDFQGKASECMASGLYSARPFPSWVFGPTIQSLRIDEYSIRRYLAGFHGNVIHVKDLVASKNAHDLDFP